MLIAIFLYGKHGKISLGSFVKLNATVK